MLNERRTLRDGIVVGLIGYASVALFYSAFDILASRGMFYTVNLLGKALFRGLRDPAVLMFPLEIDVTAAFFYNLVHLAAAFDVAILIGGANGLDEGVRARAHTAVSLAPWTLPHELARLVLAEQLYRAGTIVRREPYHK